MDTFFKKFERLPLELQQEVIDFADFLEAKNKIKKANSLLEEDFDGWSGVLSDLKDSYNSVELQHSSIDLWSNIKS